MLTLARKFRPITALVHSGLILVVSACAKVPESQLAPDNEDPGTTTPTAIQCERSGPLQEKFNITPSSIRGANIVFVLDDSGSMGDNIARVNMNIDTFLTNLSANTQDKVRLVLMFNTHGFIVNGMGSTPNPDGLTVPANPAGDSYGNSSAFGPSYANPFANKIDNQKVFYVNEGVGSRGADVALFRAFSRSTFSQVLPAVIPSDDIAGIMPVPPTATAATCNGPGKYYRPRACRDLEGAPIACSLGGDSALAQNYAACYTSPGRTVVDGDTITGPLSYLQKGISVNLVVFSDDDISVGGGFSGASTGGRTIVHNMLKQVFQPLGNTVPVYYHSIVGLQSASPAGGVGTIDRVGVNHQQLSILTDGLKADVRSSSYAGVFEQLRKKILFSEQVVNPSCEASSSITPQVYKDGVLLDPSLYTFNVGTKEVRLSPNAFVEGDLDRTIEIEVIY